MTDYTDLPRWTSTAGGGPTLRGRHGGAGRDWIHWLSGNGFCGGVYWPMLSPLAEDHRLFLHDIEGQGDSDAPPRFRGSRAVLARVPTVMDEQGLPAQGIIGMGHSYGGALTLRLADRQPERFQALVLLDPILLPRRLWLGVKLASALGRNPMSNGARRRRAVWADRTEARQRLAGRGVYAGWTEEALDHFIDHATRDTPSGRALCCPPAIEAAIFEQPFYPWAAIRRLKIPTLVLVGADSYPFFPQTIRRIRALTPQVRIERVAGDHCFMQQNPTATSDAIRAFLKTLA